MICALGASCAAGATATANACTRSSTATTPIAVESNGCPCRAGSGSCGFWVPRPMFVELETAWTIGPAQARALEASKAESRALRATAQALAATASAAAARADLWRGAALTAAELARDQAAHARRDPVLWCAVCGGAGLAAAIGAAHAVPAR